MCNHAMHCAHCEDHRGDALMFKKLAKDRRLHCIHMKEEMDAMQEKMRQMERALLEKDKEMEQRVRVIQSLKDKNVSLKSKLDVLCVRREKDAEYVISRERAVEDLDAENMALRERVKKLKREKCQVEEAQYLLKNVSREQRNAIELLQTKIQTDQTIVHHLEGELSESRKQTNALLQQDNGSLKRLDVQVEALTQQINKLRALNLHLSTTCVNKDRQLIKSEEAFEEVRRLCFGLKHQCTIFARIFQLASKHQPTQKKLLAIMNELDIEPTQILQQG